MKRGWFISFEGSEGCGKSTQIRLLSELLSAQGREVVTTREPGGTPLGETIRHLLKFAPEGRNMAPETELLLFAASRAQIVRELIRPALDRGAVVLADRFHDSTVVYQGIARGLGMETVRSINAFVLGETRPDLTLVFDLPAAEAKRRLAGRRSELEGATDRMEQEPPSFYEAVCQGYLDLARSEPHRMKVVDASSSVEVIRETVTRLLEENCHGIFD